MARKTAAQNVRELWHSLPSGIRFCKYVKDLVQRIHLPDSDAESQAGSPGRAPQLYKPVRDFPFQERIAQPNTHTCVTLSVWIVLNTTLQTGSNVSFAKPGWLHHRHHWDFMSFRSNKCVLLSCSMNSPIPAF